MCAKKRSDAEHTVGLRVRIELAKTKHLQPETLTRLNETWLQGEMETMVNYVE